MTKEEIIQSEIKREQAAEAKNRLLHEEPPGADTKAGKELDDMLRMINYAGQMVIGNVPNTEDDRYGLMQMIKDSVHVDGAPLMGAYMALLIGQRIKSKRKDANAWRDTAEDLYELADYVTDIVEHDPKYEGMNFLKLDFKEQEKILTAARKARAKDKRSKATAIVPRGLLPKQNVPNTKLINRIQELSGAVTFDGKCFNLPVYKGKDEEVTVLVTASIKNKPENITITGRQYTQYDDAVHTAICSIFADCAANGREPIITPAMVYKEISRNTGTVHKAQLQAITDSIEKMRTNLYITADYTDQIIARSKTLISHGKPGITINGKPIEEMPDFKCEMDDFMLSATGIKVTINGKIVDGYRLNTPPIMYSYAEQTGQLFTLKGNALAISEINPDGTTGSPITLNETRISIRNYLTRRIEPMRADEQAAMESLRKYRNRQKKYGNLPSKSVSSYRTMSHIILLQSIYDAVEILDAPAKTRTAAKDFTLKCFTYWKATGHIKDFKPRKNGKTIDAIEVEF